MAKDILFIAGSDIDYFYDVETFLTAGDVCVAKPLEKRVGGCVLNAASVCASLGSDVKVLDYLKENDEGTDLIIKSLSNNKVDTSMLYFGKDVTNGSCLILKNGDEKCIYVIEPKRPYFKADKKLEDQILNAKYIYSLMHILKLSFKDMNLLKEAKRRGVKIVFDGASQYKEAYEKEMLLELANAFFMNKSSYERLKESCDFDPLEYMFNKGLDFACITDGSKGATCYTKNKTYYQKAIKVDVVDSTGAGDSFAGCFLHFLDKGYDIEKCLELSSYNGAYACSKVGGMAGAISQKELFDYKDSI